MLGASLTVSEKFWVTQARRLHARIGREKTPPRTGLPTMFISPVPSPSVNVAVSSWTPSGSAERATLTYGLLAPLAWTVKKPLLPTVNVAWSSEEKDGVVSTGDTETNGSAPQRPTVMLPSRARLFPAAPPPAPALPESALPPPPPPPQ